MMRHSARAAFSGDSRRAFEHAAATLSAIGFRIVRMSDSTMEAGGPGMNSTKESPLVGASGLRIDRAAGSLQLEAELGGVRKMSRFVRWFPIVLTCGLCLVLGVVFTFSFGGGPWLFGLAGAASVNAVAWIWLGRRMVVWIEKRTRDALDALLANMVAAGGGERPASTVGSR